MSDELPPPSDDLQALLDAGKAELPNAASKAAARAALGLPTPSIAATAPASQAAAGATASGATSMAIKALVIVGIAGGAYTAGLRVGAQQAREAFEALPPKVVTVEVPVQVPAPVIEPVVVVEPVAARDAGALVRKPRAPEPTEVDDLPAELALLDAAKRALAEKNATAAMTALSSYEARFPAGALHADARLLKLEALLASGRRSEAEALGKKLSQAPSSSELVRQRVQRLLDAR